MPVKLEAVRKLALSFPETTEAPHHDYGSFRVRGRIFITIPPGGELVHIFLPEDQRDLALALDPEFIEPVHWGKKVPCVRIKLPIARVSTVNDLVKKAYAFKASVAPVRRLASKRHAAPSRGGTNAA